MLRVTLKDGVELVFDCDVIFGVVKWLECSKGVVVALP